MRYLVSVFLLFTVNSSNADTIANYMNIAENIPRMEMKADPKAQAWARSARNIITVTDESIAETIIAINDMATKQGRPLFCLGKDNLNSAMLDGIIRQTYSEISSKSQEATKLTISQVALAGLQKKYPCQLSQREKQMQRVAKYTTNYR